MLNKNDLNSMLSKPEFYAIYDKQDIYIESLDRQYVFPNGNSHIKTPYTTEFDEYTTKYDIFKYKGSVSILISQSMEKKYVKIYCSDILIYEFNTSDSFLKIAHYIPILIKRLLNKSENTHVILFEKKIKSVDLKEFNKCFVLNREKSALWLDQCCKKNA